MVYTVQLRAAFIRKFISSLFTCGKKDVERSLLWLTRRTEEETLSSQLFDIDINGYGTGVRPDVLGPDTCNRRLQM